MVRSIISHDHSVRLTILYTNHIFQTYTLSFFLYIQVGNPALNPPIRRSRRSKKSNSGIPNVAALKRMARKFKQSAKSKIEEKAGLKDGAPSNLATHMASAFMGNVNVPSNEPSPSLDPSTQMIFTLLIL